MTIVMLILFLLPTAELTPEGSEILHHPSQANPSDLLTLTYLTPGIAVNCPF